MRKVIVLIGLILLFNLSACTTRKIDDNSKLIRVAFWGAPEEVKIIKEITDKWQIENPDIKIKLDHTNYSEYGSKILTQIAGGAAPDVIFTEVDMFINFVKKGVLAPLDQFIEKDTEFKLNDFFPEVVQRFIVDDKLYCIPRDTAPFACVYYNKGLFDEAGISYPKDNWTWDDLLEKAQKLTIFNEDGRVKQYGFYTWAWKNFVYGNGGALVDDVSNPTKCLLNEEKAIQGLEFYADLINKYKVMPAPVAMDNLGMGVHAMFVMGKVGMFCSGIWETPVLKNKTKIMLLKGKKFDWDIVMFPKNKEGIRSFGTGGSGYCITKACKNKEDAWKVVKALSGDEGQIKLAETGLVQPANQKIAESKFWAYNKEMPYNKKMLNKAVKYVTYDPFHVKWAEAYQLYIIPKLDLVFNGKLTVKEAVVLFIDKVNSLLNKK